MGEEGERKETGEAEKGKEVVVVMDTPDRSKTQINTPISKFEVRYLSLFKFAKFAFLVVLFLSVILCRK